MFCTQCGKEFAEGSMTCPHCGADVASEAVENVVPEDIPAEDAADAAEAVSAPAEESEPPKKKKRRFPIKWLITAVVAVVAVVALILNMDTIVGTVIKIFGSDTAYYRYVELNSLKDGVDTVSGYYGAVTGVLDRQNYKIDGTTSIVVGEDLLELLEEQDIDLSFLNELEFSFTGNVKDQKTLINVALAMTDSDPFTAMLLLDSADGKAFFGLPSASDEYVSMDLDSAEDTGVPAKFAELLRDPAFAEELSKALPTEREINRLLDRYLTVVLDRIEVQSASKSTLTVGDLQQSCTEMKVDVTQIVVAEVGTALLNEAAADEDIKGYLARLQTFLEDKELIEDINLYEEFSDWVDDALDYMDDLMDDATDETVAKITTYIGQNHKIIGRRIVTDEESVLIATAQKGNQYATEINVSDRVVILGNGTKRGTMLTGDYEVSVEDTKMLEITLTDFDAGKAADGYLNGTIRLTPKKALFEQMGVSEDAASEASFMDLSLEFGFRTSKTENHIEVSVYKDESVMIGLVFDGKIGRGEKVELPEDTTEITDADELQEWLGQFGGDTLWETLENIGFPEEILEALEELPWGKLLFLSQTVQ